MLNIDIQNDITKNCQEIIENINRAIAWAVAREMAVVYIKHNNRTDSAGSFRPGTRGEALVPEMNVVSDNVSTKTNANALMCQEFADFIARNGVDEFYIAGADVTAGVKSICFNTRKAGYTVNVLSDCVTGYDKRKFNEMLRYYESKGCMLLRVGAL